MKVGLVLLTLLQLVVGAAAFGNYCPAGCICSDETRSVTCVNAEVDTIPILFHPLLQSLTLVNASLRILDKVAISIYRELEYLNLAGNGITEIPHGFFEELINLKEVYLQENRLKNFDNQTFTPLTQLQKLDLSRNEISRLLPNAFAENSELLALNLSANQLHFVSPSVFNGLAALEVLDLSRNRFSRLESRFFESMPALRWLSLRENMISQVPYGVFATCGRLEFLDLSSNVITTVQAAAFNGMSLLKNLTLAKNMLSSVKEPSWNYLPALEHLDLSSNALTELTTSFFDGLDSLRTLVLTNMADITRVQANAFAGLPNLETLALTGCPLLRAIDAHAFERPTRLRHLDVRNNQLTALGTEMLEWKQLESLQLSGNPWNCDCELLRLIAPLLRTLNRTDAQSAICSSPEEMLNRNLANARSTFCTPITEYALGLLAIGVLLVLFSITLIVVFCLRSRRQGCLPSASRDSSNFRVPLYTAGSSFTDSLTYDKSGHLNDSVAGRSRSVPPNAMVENGSEYYSSILLLPHSATPHGHMPQSLSPFLPSGISPYAVADPPYLYHQRPPSFVAPPPPPTVPPPPFAPRTSPVSV